MLCGSSLCAVCVCVFVYVKCNFSRAIMAMRVEKNSFERYAAGIFHVRPMAMGVKTLSAEEYTPGRLWLRQYSFMASLPIWALDLCNRTRFGGRSTDLTAVRGKNAVKVFICLWVVVSSRGDDVCKRVHLCTSDMPSGDAKFGGLLLVVCL